MSVNDKYDSQITDRDKHLHILHVDDDISLLRISKLILQSFNDDFEIDQACCVDEGLIKLSTGHYDVVISDFQMPQRNGLDFLEQLREEKNEIPFILFSCKEMEEIAKKPISNPKHISFFAPKMATPKKFIAN